jgi:hypothetical protein
MRQGRKSDLQRGLSWFLIVYMTMLVGALLGVHALQPSGGGAGTSSRSPVHQERLSTTKQTAAATTWPASTRAG